MDIKVLKYFVQVAKDQSYTRAAEHLFLSQPALSKLIKKLERELKVPLFRVQKNGVYLTDYGEQFYRRVVPIISEFDSLSAFARTRSTVKVGSAGETVILAKEAFTKTALFAASVLYRAHSCSLSQAAKPKIIDRRVVNVDNFEIYFIAFIF